MQHSKRNIPPIITLLVLMLDIVVTNTFIWIGGERWFLFLPYSLSSLILPTLIFGWQGALLSTGVFLALDSIGPRILGTSQSLPNISILVRVTVPIIVVIMLIILINITHKFRFLIKPIWTRLLQYRSPVHPSLLDETDRQQSKPYAIIEELQQAEIDPKLSVAREAWRVVPVVEAGNVCGRDGQDLRRLIYELTPDTDVELSVALERLIKEFSYRSGITMNMSLHGNIRQVKPVQYITLFRLAQEALLNIQQHAQAHSANLSLHFDGQKIILTIQDDGVGLLDGTHERSGMHALRAMRHRLAEIDGYLEVIEHEDKGISIRGVVPH